jgi:predicted flap endonuclease-1-like 5' DNA nuclease
MLAGTFLLGVLLGYLIWGWLKDKVATLEEALKMSRSIANAKDAQNASQLLRNSALEESNQSLDTKISLSEYRLRRSQEELGVARAELEKFNVDKSAHADSPISDLFGQEPTLADISQAMELGGDDTPEEEETVAGKGISASLRRGITSESLEVAAQVFGTRIHANDLKIVRGIGPKLEEVLHRAGIPGWADLALSGLPALRGILEEAGPRYRSFDPKTWSAQARMAARGEWRKLQAYQDTLTELGE